MKDDGEAREPLERDWLEGLTRNTERRHEGGAPAVETDESPTTRGESTERPRTATS